MKPENDDLTDRDSPESGEAGAGENPFGGPVEIPIGDSLDLHLFRPGEIRDAVEGYIEAAAEKGIREARLIHGKGKGEQRRHVQTLLARHPLVERFADAPESRGGWGATLVWLRPAPPAAEQNKDSEYITTKA